MRIWKLAVLIDMTRERPMWGIQEQIKGKWYGLCADGRALLFDYCYDARFFLAMMREITGRAKSKKSKKRNIRRKQQ